MKNNQLTPQWDAAHYKQHSSIQYEQAMQLISAYPFKGDETILDIGCGDGKVTYQVALKTPHGRVSGLDQSDSMLALAKKDYAHVDNIKFIKGNAQKLEFYDMFDLVTSFCCLHWPENKPATFSGIYRSLKTGGKALLTMPMGSKVCVQTPL
ncbi:MAG: class I SAM-dependent methyltransferase [Gammaproteobacteria bacterium]|nr:class I SAM-dependent methyltransferase [Gammaproteobacteria bacterium]